jgi:nucleotide-binding universal stress UspA family protein
MARAILVGYDPRTLDYAPVHFGAALARLSGAPLIIASVDGGGPRLPPGPGPSLAFVTAELDDDLVADCTPALDEVADELEPAGIPVECRKIRGTSVARALHETAEAEDAGLLVVGASRARAAGGALPGSTADRLLHGAPCAVAVTPHRWTTDGELDAIGVAFVDTESGREALRGAYALARRSGATLRVLTVVRPTVAMYLETEAYTAARRAKYFEDVLGEHKLEAMRAAERAVADLEGDAQFEIEGLIGDPAEVLADVSIHLDVLVCGSRDYGPLRAVLLGGVSRRLAGEARCPLIVLPRGVESALEALLVEAPGTAAPA